MEQPSALQVYQEGDTHIGRTEGLDTDMFVFVGVALIDVGGIFRWGAAVLQDVFGEYVADVGPQFFPWKNFAIEVVGMEMRA